MRAELTVAMAYLLVAGVEVRAEEHEPSFDFLEYLGSLVEDEGAWTHPDDLDHDAEADAENDNYDAAEDAVTEEEVL